MLKKGAEYNADKSTERAIYESEQEAAGGAEALEANAAFEELEKKYFG